MCSEFSPFTLYSSETRVNEDEDLYDCVYGEDEGGEVYEDLMKAEAAHQLVSYKKIQLGTKEIVQ